MTTLSQSGPVAHPYMVGFGFGDAVIMELVKDKGLLPDDLRTGAVGAEVLADPGLKAHPVFYSVSVLIVQRMTVLST